MLADITNAAENNYVKTVLKAVQAKDGTDYFIGGVDSERNTKFKWLNGKSLFNDLEIEQKKLLRRYSSSGLHFKKGLNTLILTILVIQLA